MEQWRRDELDELERLGYIPVLRSLVNSLTSPFWWFDPDGRLGSSIIHNGTICFVDTGANVLGVTASHVYEEYLAAKKVNNEIVCQIGSSTFDPERYLIAHDVQRDLATFSIPEFLITAADSNIHHAPTWPPVPLESGDLVIMGGYPGPLRTEKPQNAEFSFVSFISPVNQDSEDHISFYLNLENSHWPQGESLESRPDLGRN